jgi:hypothetical protein
MLRPSYKIALMPIAEFNWGDECLTAEPLKKALGISSKADNLTNKEVVAGLNDGKLYWGKPMVISEVTGENYMATMEYCSHQMENLAKTRGPVKTAWDNMQIKAWTKLRAEAAKSYLETERYHCMMEHIDALQWEIDGATAVGDKAECRRLIAKIEPLRKEIARIEKWVRDLKKLD